MSSSPSSTTSSDLTGKVDMYNGIIVDSEALPCEKELFSIVLQASLEVWKVENRRGIWLSLPIPSHVELLSEALNQGFSIHHGTKDNIMLTQWLPSSPNTLPLYASHYIGVGGFVLNDKNQVLAIQEKNGPAKTFWKIPGGAADPGEDVAETAIREVFEETGISADFEKILSFRQHHTAPFGKSDMYFVCLLRARDFKITIQESEIAAAQWMDIDELLNAGYLRSKGVYYHMLALGKDYIEGKYAGISAESLPIGFRPGNNTVYSAQDSKL